MSIFRGVWDVRDPAAGISRLEKSVAKNGRPGVSSACRRFVASETFLRSDGTIAGLIRSSRRRKLNLTGDIAR